MYREILQGHLNHLSNWEKFQLLLKDLNACFEKFPILFPKKIRVFSKRDCKKHFEAFSGDTQLRLLSYFDFYVQTILNMTSRLEAPRNSKQFLWRAFTQLGFRPSDDLLSQIADGDCIEAYSPEGVQIFRCFSVMEMVSYAIEDLVVFSWDTLFYRDPELTTALVDQAIKVFSGEMLKTSKNEISGKHLVKEIASDEFRRFEIEFGIVSPLRYTHSSEVGAFVSTFKLHRVLYE